MQAWTGYGVAYPIVCQFFGIEPNAYEKRFRLAPHLPGAWKTAALSDVKIGANRIGVKIELASEMVMRLSTAEPGWKVDFVLPRRSLPNGTDPLTVTVNGRVVAEKSHAEMVRLALRKEGSYEIRVTPGR